MCKILTLTKTTKIKGLDKAIQFMSELVSETERHGVGYALQTTKGVYGERTTTPDEFSVSKGKAPLTVPYATPTTNSFGERGKASGALMVHGRTSTNHKTLVNTHPIVKHDWTLIHNGVVTNNGPKYQMITSNDTEHLVHYLAKGGIKDLETNITGYYAITAIDPDGRLHVVKDSIAPLYTAYIETIDSHVFATAKDHIEELCKFMKWTSTYVSPLNNNVYVIFENGEMTECTSFSPRGFGYKESKHASASLGRTLYDEDASYADAGYIYDSTTGTKRESFDWRVLQDADAKEMDKLANREDGEEKFLEEMHEFGDTSYTIMNYRNDKLTIEEFERLDRDQKLSCTVIRPDGTVCDPYDYYTDRLYDGAIA